MKTRFHDAHERRAYLCAAEIARRIVDDPAVLARGAAHLERFARDDPWRRPSYELWRETLQESAGEIARRLLEDSEAGATLRGSMPLFVTFSREDLRRLWSEPRA